jgi:hypothetical protein
MLHYIYGPPDIKPGELLQDKVRRIRYIKFGAIWSQFFLLNLVGKCVCSPILLSVCLYFSLFFYSSTLFKNLMPKEASCYIHAYYFMIGMFANRFFILYTADNEFERWTWMETFYWSIQTTTTMYVPPIIIV